MYNILYQSSLPYPLYVFLGKVSIWEKKMVDGNFYIFFFLILALKGPTKGISDTLVNGKFYLFSWLAPFPGTLFPSEEV